LLLTDNKTGGGITEGIYYWLSDLILLSLEEKTD
jgi:hypothetical protein